MSYQVSPKQALLLWRMITAETPAEREPKLADARPSLDPKKERQSLIDRGLLTLEKRGRATHLVLTDQGWAWAATHVNVEIMKSRSTVGAEALQGLLRRLLPFLQQHKLPLAALFSSSPSVDNIDAAQAADAGEEQPALRGLEPAGSTLEDRIEAACLRLAAGSTKTRVRLAALRNEFGAVPRAILDAALLALQDTGKLVLYRDDNAAALTDADHRAALIVGDAPRHLVYLEG